ncbi:MAG: HAD-IIIC family phosphatase, partial [Candidatus Omnitrophica bacterium]|nr:HAD-IIIC family phosphatase [Candidatus Omnitrophota bacterium]
AATVLSEENTGFPLRPRFSVGFAMPDLRPATAEDAHLQPAKREQPPAALPASQPKPASPQITETMIICGGIVRQLRYYHNVREDMLCKKERVSDIALAREILQRTGCEYELGRWVLSSGKDKQEVIAGLEEVSVGRQSLIKAFPLEQEAETQAPEKMKGAIYIYLKQALRTTIKFVNIDRLMNSGNIAEGQRDFVKEALSRMGLNENADENQALWYFPEDREKLRLDLEDVFAKRLQNFDAVFPVRAQEVIAAPGTVPLARQEIAMAGTVPVALEAPESEEEVRMRILNYVSDTFPRTRFYILDILESCQTENRALVEDTLRRLKIRPVGGAWFLWHGHNPCTIQNGINRVKQGELFDTVFPLLKEQAPVSVLPESRTVSTAFTVTAPDGKFELNANTVDWLADNLLRALQARQAGQPIEEVVIEGVEARSLSPSQANGWKGVLKSRFALEDSLRIGASISIRLPNSWRSYELNALREKLLENWAMKNKDCPGGLSAKVLAADFGLDRSKVEGILNQAYLGFSKSATDPDIYVKRQSVTTRPQAFPVKRSSVERARDDIVRQLDIPQGQGGRRTFYLSYYLSRYGLSPQEVEQLFAKETCTPGGKRFWFKKHVGDDGQVGFRAIKKESGTDLSASADETNKYPAAIRPLAQYEQFRPAELKVIFMYKKVKIDVLERGSLIQGQLKLLEERLGKAYVDSNQEVFEVAIRITPNTSIIEIPEAGVCRVVSEYDVKDREIRLYPLFIEIDELLAQVFNYPHYDSATLHFINSCLRDELGHARGLGQEVGDKNTLEGMDFWVLSCNIDVLSREDNKVIYALGSWLGRMKLCKGMQLFLDADYNKAVIELQAAIKEFTKLSESKIQELGKEAEIAALLVRAAETMNGNQLLRGSNVFECISTMPQWQKEHFQFLGTVLRTVLQLINRGIDPGDILKYGLAPLSVIAKTTDELKLCLETAERLALDLSSDVEEINRFIQFEIPLIAFDSRDPRQTESRLRMITEEQGQERVVLAAKQCWFDNFRRAFSHEYTDCEQEGPGGPDWQHGYLNNGLVEINAYKQFIGLFTRRIKQILDVSACDWNKALEQVSSEVVTIGNVFFGYAIDFEREQDGARIYYHWDQEQDISICPAFPRQSSLEVKHEDPGQGSNRPVKVDENDRIHIEAQADTIDRNYRETIKKVNADLPRCQRDELLLRLYKQNPYSRQEKFSSFWPRIYRRVFMPKKDPKAPQTDNSVYLAVTEAIDWLDEVGAVSTFARLRKLDELDAKYRLERYRILAQKAILEPGVGGVIQVAKKRFGEIAWNEDKNKEIKDHSEKGFDEKLINVEVIRFGKSEGNTMAPLHDAQLKKLEKVLKSDSLVISQRDREFLERGKEKLRKLEIASSGEERFEKAIELVAGRLPFADRLWIEELLQFRGVHFIRAPTGWSVGACIIETIISKQKYYYIILPENTKPGIIAHEIQAVLFPISHQENELLENEGFAALSDNAKERITKTLREVAFGDLLDPRAGYEQYLPEIMLGTLSVVTGIGLFYQFVLHPYLRHRRRKMREANSVNTVTSNSQKERDLALKAELRRIRAQFRLTRTDVEEIISAPYSHDRGKQLIENQISGKNLGEVVSLALSEMVQQGLLFNGKVPWIFSKSGRFTIEHMAKIEGDSLKRLWELRWMLGKFNIRPVEARVLKLVCRFVSTRAAKLTAALLLVKQGQIADKSSHTRAVSVSIPGADFSKYPHFVKNIENTVKSCLGEQRASLLSLDLMHDASSGSTMVYLFHSQDSDIGLDAQDKRIAEAVHNVRAFVLGDIKEFDEHVAEKKEAFLSRLYHALERTFNSIIVKAHSGRIDPFVDINLMKFSSQIQDPLLHKTDRHVKVGFFPIAGNPLNWGHILPPLMCLNTLNMDTIVLRVQGEIGYKKLLACERVSVQDRHFMVREAIKGMFPLVRYTDLCSEENNHDEGAESMHHFLEMNPDRRIHLFYLIGAENEQRMWTYMRQQYEFFQRFNFGANPSHKITFSVIQRGEYGANVTLEELQDISRKCQVESGSKELLDVALVKDPDIDLRVSSTYYRNTQDGAYVPNNVHEFAKLRGYYGHPPIDPMTGQPVTDSQEKYFRMRLEAIARKMALQTEAVINRVPGGMPFISIDGGSGSGKTTIAEEVGRYLEEKGYDSQIIPLDMFLKDRVWRMAIQKLVTGRKLNDKEMVLVGDLKDKIQARQPYLDEEAFFDHGRILSLLELLERFRRGEDGLNVSETVDYLNGATGLDMAIIPKGTLLDKQCWRLLILDLLNGLPLEQQEKQNLADFVLNIQRNQPLPQMPIIFKDERVGEMAKDKIDEALRFLNADNQSHGLIILNAYGQTTKMIGSRLFGLRRGTIIAFEGKYANREELAPCFDLRYRLHDDPDRTKARFEIRSRKQSPDDADMQLIFYGFSLVPSYQIYDKKTERLMHGFIDLGGEEWFLDDSAQGGIQKQAQCLIIAPMALTGLGAAAGIYLMACLNKRQILNSTLVSRAPPWAKKSLDVFLSPQRFFSYFKPAGNSAKNCNFMALIKDLTKELNKLYINRLRKFGLIGSVAIFILLTLFMYFAYLYIGGSTIEVVCLAGLPAFFPVVGDYRDRLEREKPVDNDLFITIFDYASRIYVKLIEIMEQKKSVMRLNRRLKKASAVEADIVRGKIRNSPAVKEKLAQELEELVRELKEEIDFIVTPQEPQVLPQKNTPLAYMPGFVNGIKESFDYFVGLVKKGNIATAFNWLRQSVLNRIIREQIGLARSRSERAKGYERFYYPIMALKKKIVMRWGFYPRQGHKYGHPEYEKAEPKLLWQGYEMKDHAVDGEITDEVEEMPAVKALAQEIIDAITKAEEDLFRKKRQPVLPALEAFKDEPKFRRGQIREFSAKLDECIKRLKMSDEQKNKTPLKIKILAAMEIRTVQDLLKLNYLFKTRQVLINVREGFLSAREIEAGNIRKRIWQGHLPVMREATSQRNKTMRDLAGEIKDGLQTDDTFNASQKRITLQLKGYLKKCDILAWSKAAQEPEYYWVREAAQGIRSALTYYSEAARQRVKGMCVYIMRKAKTADILAKLMERYRSLYVDLRLKKMPHEQARDKAFNDAYQDFATDANISRGSPKDYLYFAFFYMAVYIRTKGKKKPTEKAPITNPVFHAALVLIRIIEAKKLTYLNKLGRNAQEKVDSLNDKENFSKLTTGQMYEVVDAIAVDRELAEAQKQELLRMIRYPGDFSALRDTQPPKAGTSSKSKRRVSPGSSAIVNAAKLVLSCASIFFLQRAFGYFGLTFGVALAMVAPPLFWGSWISDADREEINDADTLSNYIDALEENVCEGYTVGMETEAYDRKFLRPLFELFFLRLERDFSQAEEFIARCRQVLDRQDAFRLRGMMNDRYRMLTTAFIKVKRDHAAQEASVGFYGLLMFYLTAAPEFYLGHLYGEYMKTKSSIPLSISRKNISYHTRGDSIVYLYDKVMLYEGEHAKYTSSLDFRYGETKPQEPTELQDKENKEKLQEAIRVWGECLLKDTPRETRKSIEERRRRFIDTATVIQLKMRTPLLFSDPEHKVVRILHTGRSRRAQFFSKTYLDNLRIDDGLDMLELAFWLNFGQRFIDSHDRMLAVKKEKKEELHAIQNTVVGVNQSFLRHPEDGFFVKPADFKKRLTELMREDILRIYKDVLAEAVKEEKETDALLFSGVPLDGKNFTQFCQARDAYLHLLYRYEGMGMHLRAENAYQKMKAVITAIQEFDHKILPLEYQRVLVFTALRFGRFGDFITELRALLTGERSRWRRKRYMAEVLTSRLTITQSMGDGKSFEDDVRRTLATQLEAATPQMLDEVLAVEEEVNRLFRNYFSDPIANFSSENISNETPLEDRKGIVALSYLQQNEEKIKSISPKNPTSNSNNPNSSAFPGIVSKKKLAEHSGEPTYKYEIKFDEENKDYVLGEPIIINRGTKLADFAVREACLNELLRRLVFGYEEAAPRMAAAEMERNMRKQGFASSFTLVITGDEELLKSANDNNLSILPSGHNKWCRDENLYIAAVNLAKDVYSKQRNKEYPENTIFIHPAFFALSIQRQYEVLYHEARSHIGKMLRQELDAAEDTISAILTPEQLFELSEAARIRIDIDEAIKKVGSSIDSSNLESGVEIRLFDSRMEKEDTIRYLSAAILALEERRPDTIIRFIREIAGIRQIMAQRGILDNALLGELMVMAMVLPQTEDLLSALQIELACINLFADRKESIRFEESCMTHGTTYATWEVCSVRAMSSTVFSVYSRLFTTPKSLVSFVRFFAQEIKNEPSLLNVLNDKDKLYAYIFNSYKNKVKISQGDSRKKGPVNPDPNLQDRMIKCIVLDCDNTLWAGIIDEVGTREIRVTPPYAQFQRALLAFKEKGIILAINSKNELEDIEEVLEYNQGMVLKKDDFAVIRANWQEKAFNMLEIARELNIGLDSIAFIDDSSKETVLIRMMLPEILVFDFPADIEDIPILLQELSNLTPRGSITSEDSIRTQLYDAKRQRDELRKRLGSLQAYYCSLGMRILIREGMENRPYIARIVQLIGRTNQFNLNDVKRYPGYDERGIEDKMEDDSCRVFTLELEDIFGSGGIVGVIILKKIRVRGDGWQIEVFCLSCRAIGLTVEQAFLAHLIKKLKEEAALTLRGIYRPSGKNKLVSDLYTRLGFLSVSSHLYGSDVKCYDFNLSKGNLEVPPWIIVHKKEDPDLFALADKKPVESGNIPKGNIFQVRVNDIIYLHLRPLAFLAGVIVKKLGEPPLSIEVRFSRTAKTLEDSVPGNSMIQMTKLAFPTGRCAWCRSMNMYLRSSLPKSILEEAEAILKDVLHGKGLEKTGFAPRETYFPDQANKQYRERIKRLAEKVSSSGLGALCVLLLASVVALIFTHLVGVWGLGGVCLAVAPFLAFKESDLKPIKQFNAFKVKIKGDFDISFYEARSDFGKPLALVDNGWSFKAVFSSQALEKFRCFISGLNMRFTLRAFSFYIYLRESREWGHVQASESMSKIYPVEVSRAIDKFASEVLGSQIALVKEKKRKAKRKEYIANTVKKTDCSSSGQFEDKELEIIRQALAHPDSEFLVIEEINLEKGSCRIRTMRSGRKQGDTATDADISGNARRHCRYILDAKEYAEAACNGKLEILERLYIILRLPERIMVNNGKNSPDYYALRLPEDGDIVVGDKFTRACYDKGLQAMIISGVTFNSPAKLFSCFAHEAGIRLDAENGLCKEEQHLNGIRRELRVVYRLWMDERVSKDGYRKEMARLTISFLNLEAVLLKQNNRLLRGASLRRTLQLGKQMRGLCKKLEDSDSEERIEAARAILEFCRQQFSDILVLLWFRMGAVKISEHFVNEGDDDVRAEYLSVLGFIHAFHPESESAENDIARIFLNLFEVTPLLRKAALKAISQMKQPYSYFDRLLYYSMKSIFKFSEREERSLALGAIGNSVDLRSFRLAPVVREAFEYMKEIAKEESSGNNEDDGVAEDGARALLSAIMNYRCPLSIKEQCKAITQIEKIFKRKIDVLKRQLEGGAHPCAETYFVETHALFHGTSAYLAEIFDLRKSKDKDYHPWLRLTAAQALREMTRSYLAYINTVSEKMRTPSLSEEYTLLIKEMVLSLCWPVALNKKMLRVELNHAVYKALLEIICEFAQDSGLKRLLLLGTDATSVQAAKNICRLRGPNFMRALIDDFRGSHSTILVILVKALKEWENKHKGLLKRGYFGNLSPERIKEYRKAIAKDPTLIEPLQEFDEMAITITDTEVRHCIWSRKAQAFSGWIVEPSIFPIFDEKNNILTVVYSRGAYREIKMNFSADLLKPVFLIDYHEHMEEVQGFCHVYVYEEIKKTSKLGGVALTLEEIFPPFEDAYYKEHFLEYGGFEIIMLDNFVTQVIRKEMSGEESVSFRCVEEAKALVQRIAEKNGFSWIERSKLKQLAHELTFNMLEFARGGVFGAAAIKRQGKCVIEIVGWDSGCGMRDPQAILEYSLKKGERHGLGFKKFTKLADWLEIEALKQLWEMDEEKKFILRGESRVNDGTRISLGVVQKRKRSSLEFFPFLVPQEFQAQDIERNTAAEDACLAVLLKELEDENPARAPPHIIVTTEAGLLNDDDANIHVASRNRHHAIVFLHPYFFRLYPLLQKIILYHELFSHIEKKLNDPEALRDTYEHFGFIDRSSLFPQNERLRRVLIITHVFGGATGQEVYIKNLASYLVQRGYVVHILYTTPDKQAKDQSLVDGLLHYWPVYQQRKTHHDIFPWVYFFLVLKLHRILSNFKVDFINLHSAFRLPPSIVAWYGRLIKKLPIYMTVHNSRRWGSFSLVNWCSKAVAAMNKLFVHRKTAVSRTAAEALGANTVVVGNPFNLEVFNPYDQTTEEAASKWREGLNLSPKTKIIFYPSRITPAKGQLELIGMAAILKEKRRDFAVVMIGEVSHREYYNQLKSEIDKRGLSGTVFILDRLAQEELAPLYAASYFVAMPTQHPEGLPTVCLEAFAMKKPVVAYDSGGTREVVRILDNGHETGIIKPQGDIAGFTQTMDLLLDDPRWVSLMGRQARKVAEKEFAPEICVDKFVSLFNQGTPSNSIPRLRSGPPSVVGRVSQKIAGILILVSLAFVVSLLMDSIACGLVSCALASVTLIPGTSGEKRSNLEDSDPYTRSVLHDLKNKLFASQLCKLIIDMYKEVAEAQAVLAVVRQHSQIYSNLSKASIDFFEGRCAFQEVIRVFNENYNPFIETIKQLRAYTGNVGSNCEDPLKNHINGLVDHAINNGLLRRYH